jgi:hypothetical protein
MGAGRAVPIAKLSDREGSITDLGAGDGKAVLEEYLPVILDCCRFYLDVCLLQIS